MKNNGKVILDRVEIVFIYFQIQIMTSLIDFYATNYRAQLPLYITNTKKNRFITS